MLTQMLSRSVSDMDAGIRELNKGIHSLSIEQGSEYELQ
jgi:hypothetical protein